MNEILWAGISPVVVRHGHRTKDMEVEVIFFDSNEEITIGEYPLDHCVIFAEKEVITRLKCCIAACSGDISLSMEAFLQNVDSSISARFGSGEYWFIADNKGLVTTPSTGHGGISYYVGVSQRFGTSFAMSIPFVMGIIGSIRKEPNNFKQLIINVEEKTFSYTSIVMSDDDLRVFIEYLKLVLLHGNQPDEE